MRTPFLAGNWKMHLDGSSVGVLCDGLLGLTADDRAAGGQGEARVGVFPPFVYLSQVVEALAGSGVAVGAQTGRPEAKGAFTGEVSLAQVADVGATHVLAGHSERRQIFGESDAEVRLRLDAALDLGLDVILCVGETLDERQAGRTNDVVLRQIVAGTSGLDGELLANRISIAYEPVWAIGTGEVATPAQAQEVHAAVRGRLAADFGDDVAARVTIQYGGSVKPGNVAELMACPDVDGALVGGASLDFDSFRSLVRIGS